jgi:hypothetical protein
MAQNKTAVIFWINTLVLCNRYRLPIAARSLGEFQKATEALPRRHSGLAEGSDAEIHPKNCGPEG